MSTELPSITRVLRSQAKVTIVAATYNERYTSALLQNCLDELQERESIEVDVVRVPGAFEVPVMVKRAICKAGEGEEPDAVIALGVIIRGSTAHADLIGASVCNQLQAIACETVTPVINEVLLLNDEQQAFARCIASSLNRGREAARATINILSTLEDQHALHSSVNRSAKIDRHASIFR